MSNKMKGYTIKVERIVPFYDLDYDDKNEWPQKVTSIKVMAENEEMALDEFHATHPIAVLDDFSIEVEYE